MRYIPVHRIVFDHGRRGRFVSGCWVYLERFWVFLVTAVHIITVTEMAVL